MKSVANIRAIRAMALGNTFHTRFTDDLSTTLRSGNVAAWGTGIGTGTGAALPYFVQGESSVSECSLTDRPKLSSRIPHSPVDLRLGHLHRQGLL